METWIIWIVVRLLVPLTILRWPFWGTLLSSAVDMLDYRFINPANTFQTQYQITDKFLDTYYLGFAAYTSLSWKDHLAKKISIFSYLFRLFGVLLFSITQLRQFLFLFPNFFESFFFFYHIYRYLAKREKLFFTKKLLIILIPALIIPKLMQEYFLHILETHPIEIIKSHFTTHIPDPVLIVLQTFLYLLLPVGALLWTLTRNSSPNKSRTRAPAYPLMSTPGVK